MNSLDKLLEENNKPYREMDFLLKSVDRRMCSMAYLVDEAFKKSLFTRRNLTNIERIETALGVILNPKYKNEYGMELYHHDITTVKPFNEDLETVAFQIYDANYKSLDTGKLITGVFDYLYNNYGLQYVNHYKPDEDPYIYTDRDKIWNTYYDERLNKGYSLTYRNKKYYLIASNREYRELTDCLNKLHHKYNIKNISLNIDMKKGNNFVSKNNLDKFIYYLKGQVDYSNQSKFLTKSLDLTK